MSLRLQLPDVMRFCIYEHNFLVQAERQLQLKDNANKSLGTKVSEQGNPKVNPNFLTPKLSQLNPKVNPSLFYPKTVTT